MDLELILTRRSPLTLRGPGPDEAALRTMLAAAMCGPDHGRLTPWRFTVIEGDGRLAFGRVLREALHRRVAGADEAMLAREEAKAFRAPMIVVVSAKVHATATIPVIEQVVAAGIAAYNILLAARAVGLGGLWRTGAHAYDPGVRHALGLGLDETIVGFLYLGTPDAVPPPRPRADAAAFVRGWPPAGDS